MTDFPHIILDNGKIVSPSIGKEYSMHHVQFISEDADEIFEIFEKLSKVCNKAFPTIKCPDCKGKGSTEESSKAGTHCFTCEGNMVVAK